LQARMRLLRLRPGCPLSLPQLSGMPSSLQALGVVDSTRSHRPYSATDLTIAMAGRGVKGATSAVPAPCAVAGRAAEQDVPVAEFSETSISDVCRAMGVVDDVTPSPSRPISARGDGSCTPQNLAEFLAWQHEEVRLHLLEQESPSALRRLTPATTDLLQAMGASKPSSCVPRPCSVTDLES